MTVFANPDLAPARATQVALTLLAASITIEVTLLAGLTALDTRIYHLLHLALMAALIINQVWLYKSSEGNPHRRYAAWVAVGLISTGVGDYVNGALSPVRPVSTKLTWALLLFGIGYAIYVAVLASYRRSSSVGSLDGSTGWIALGAPSFVLNLLAWVVVVRPQVVAYPLLAIGSLVFCLTLYVALPAFGQALYRQSGFAPVGLALVFATILIPYSDLVLFGTWLDGNPDVASFPLYACNWVLYFSGQALFSVFPPWAISSAISYGRGGQTTGGREVDWAAK